MQDAVLTKNDPVSGIAWWDAPIYVGAQIGGALAGAAVANVTFGIEDRIATLDIYLKTDDSMREWFGEHGGRHSVLVAERNDRTVGWASLNPCSHRCADKGVADVSVYVEREARGTGVGRALLSSASSP